MSDTVTTRIRLPAEVHRQVKAAAAMHSINLDEALGMCVAFVCDITAPLSWREGAYDVADDLVDHAPRLRRCD